MLSQSIKNWPKTIPYAKVPFSHDVSMKDLRLLLFPPLRDQPHRLIEEEKVYPHLEIKILKKPHVLGGKKTKLGHFNRGVFATKDIKEKTLLGEYAGLFVVDFCDQFHRRQTTSFEYCWVIYHEHFVLSINALFGGNILAFVNDYRNIKEEPNVKATFFSHKNLHYFCYETTKIIKAGEELLIDYLPQQKALLGKEN